jgi:hypothetical protein
MNQKESPTGAQVSSHGAPKSAGLYSKRTLSDYVNIVETNIRQERQRPPSIKRIADIASTIANKLRTSARRRSDGGRSIGSSNGGSSIRIARSEIVDQLKLLGFSDLEINEAIRMLEDRNELFLVQDCSLICYEFYQSQTSFDLNREKLQTAWIQASELETFSVNQAEQRELKKFEKLQREKNEEAPHKK